MRKKKSTNLLICDAIYLQNRGRKMIFELALAEALILYFVVLIGIPIIVR